VKLSHGIGLLGFGWTLAMAGCSTDSTTLEDGGTTADGGRTDSAPTGDSSPGTDSGTDATPGPDSGLTPQTFTATLTGAQENPPVASTATGTVTITVNAERTKATYTVTHNVAGGNAAHIHKGAGGSNGPVVHPLVPFSTNMTGTLDITPADATDIEQGLWYVNVHSATNADGELRGQLLAPGATMWVAKLGGSQENPPVVTTATGGAAVILDKNKTSLRYFITSTITPTAAHIHKGIASLNGPVVVTFPTLGTAITGVSPVTAADATDLEEGRFYVNLHTTLNANGEVRGQLIKAGEALYLGRMSGLSEVPPLTTAASGGSQFILDPVTRMLRYEAVFSGMTATASHIHEGAVGTNGAVSFPLTLAGPGAKGSVTLTQANVDTLRAAGYYVNAHTALNLEGEIRAQILAP
jgi:hypothetical protein